jgi:hypothetical protein
VNEIAPAWHAILAWAKAEIDRLRQKNDLVGLSDAETNALRGEIRALKRLIDLPNEAARRAQIPAPGMPGADDS